jgi:hypothetical protein
MTQTPILLTITLNSAAVDLSVQLDSRVVDLTIDTVCTTLTPPYDFEYGSETPIL